MPQYSLLGGLADPAYMSGVTTQGQPYIDPITGRLVTGTGDLYTGERPLETPPLLGGAEYQPADIPPQLTREDIADRYNAYSKPDYSPGKIASLILTSPLRLLSGLDQELKGALGIPTVEDTAEYGRTHYGGGEPTGLGERFLGALTGESQREARATRATSHDALQNLALRKNALETNRKLQQLFGGAYDLYGKPTQLEKGERELDLQRRFGLPSAAADFESKIRNLQILRETGLPQALATLDKTRQDIDRGNIKLQVENIMLRMKQREEGADLQLEALLNDPVLGPYARNFVGANAYLLKDLPLLPKTVEAIRQSEREGVATQGATQANRDAFATQPSSLTGLRPAEQSARDATQALNDMKAEFAKMKADLEAQYKGLLEKRAGYDDLAKAFDDQLPTKDEIKKDLSGGIYDKLRGASPKFSFLPESKQSQYDAILARKGDVLALYQAGKIDKEQATQLVNNPNLSIGEILPDYEAALAEIRRGKSSAAPNVAPTPNPTPTIDPIDRVVTEEDTPRPRPTATPGTARLPSDVQDSKEPDHRQLDDESEAKKFYLDEWKRRFGSESARDKKGRTANELFPFFYSSTGPSGWDAQKKELRK